MYDYHLTDTILEVSNLNVSFGNNSVLRDVSFKIDDIVMNDTSLVQGQVVALLAPSGMGKSQLLRCISGLRKQDSGKVVLYNKDEVKSGMVGVVAQDYPLFDHLTIMDNLMTAAMVKIKDHKQAKETCENYLNSFDLLSKKNNYPHEISGGQRQRISILQQMVSCGHILLMDEPFSGLDILMKEKAQKMISDLSRADELNTIILTTHDISSAIAVADTILLLGRERDVNGDPIQGAKIMQRYNLIDMGLAWRPNIKHLPAFKQLEDDISEWFKRL